MTEERSLGQQIDSDTQSTSKRQEGVCGVGSRMLFRVGVLFVDVGLHGLDDFPDSFVNSEYDGLPYSSNILES